MFIIKQLLPNTMKVTKQELLERIEKLETLTKRLEQIIGKVQGSLNSPIKESFGFISLPELEEETKKTETEHNCEGGCFNCSEEFRD
jgi:hypothetical protein